MTHQYLIICLPSYTHTIIVQKITKWNKPMYWTFHQKNTQQNQLKKTNSTIKRSKQQEKYKKKTDNKMY